MSKINFKEEILECLKLHNKTVDEIQWIGCKDYRIPMDEFWKLANVDYNNNCLYRLIPYDLLIVGLDWWMERNEYNGFEWWEFKEICKEPKEIYLPLRLITYGVSLSSIKTDEYRRKNNEN